MSKGNPRLSFGTDFHGNLESIDYFLDVSKEENVDHVIFGGDVMPKKMAIQFGDGNTAIAFPQESDPMNSEDATNLYQRGYMLFHEAMSFEEIKTMQRVCNALRSSSNHSRIILEQEELFAFETKILPLIRDYLTRSDHGRETWARHKSKTVNEADCFQLRDADEFIHLFLQELKMNYLGSKGLLQNKNARNEFLFGNPEATNQDFADLLSQMSKISMNISLLITPACTYHMPWNRWEQIHQTLDEHSLKGQQEFLNDLLERVDRFRRSFKGTVSLILGNDDLIEHQVELDRADQAGLLQHATNKVVALSKNTQLLGYAPVPPIESVGYKPWFRSEAEIEKELLAITKAMRRDATYTIANIHCPPNRSMLSQGQVEHSTQTDFGSQSVRNFLEQVQPTVTLTGHIHRAWELTGTVVDRIRKTVVFNPGDSEYSPRILISDLKDPLSSFRIRKPETN